MWQHTAAHLEARVLAAAAHAKLIHVGLAQQHSARSTEARHRSGVVRRNVPLQLLAAGSGGQAL